MRESVLSPVAPFSPKGWDVTALGNAQGIGEARPPPLNPFALKAAGPKTSLIPFSPKG
jgi:hypothetical protein